MPRNRVVTPGRDLERKEIKPPSKHPLRTVAWGYAEADTGFPIVRFDEPIPQLTFDVLNEALCLASSIIIHEKAITSSARILSGEPSPRAEVLIGLAIHEVLATHRWRVILSYAHPVDFGFGHTVREPESQSKPCPRTLEQRETIFINPFCADNLTEARAILLAAEGSPPSPMRSEVIGDAKKRWQANLLFCGIGFAHEICHSLRVKVAARLAPYPEVSMSHNTPERAGATTLHEGSEGGWRFEQDVFGGECALFWPPSRFGPPRQKVELGTNYVAGPSISWLAVESNPQVPVRPVVMLPEAAELLSMFKRAGPSKTVILKGEKQEVDPEWIEHAVTDHRHGFKDVQLPPRLLPDAVNMPRGHILGRISKRRTRGVFHGRI